MNRTICADVDGEAVVGRMVIHSAWEMDVELAGEFADWRSRYTVPCLMRPYFPCGLTGIDGGKLAMQLLADLYRAVRDFHRHLPELRRRYPSAIADAESAARGDGLDTVSWVALSRLARARCRRARLSAGRRSVVLGHLRHRNRRYHETLSRTLNRALFRAFLPRGLSPDLGERMLRMLEDLPAEAAQAVPRVKVAS